MKEKIEYLNHKFAHLNPEERISELYKIFDPNRILITSSFGTSSAFLLSLISRVIHRPKIHFIDTGYLFSETHEYLEQLSILFGLEIITLKPEPADHAFSERNRTWESEPDFCCEINKVNPLEKIKPDFDVWMTGIMKYQNEFRNEFNIFEQQDILKLNPVLDVTREELVRFSDQYQLPEHPLKKRGFGSVGCTHCTVPGKDRTGRWAHVEKTECGLHADTHQ